MIEPEDVLLLERLADRFIDRLAEKLADRVASLLSARAIDRTAWTAAEVAESIGVSVATVHELAKAENGIPPVDVSERILRFRPEDVRAWAERRLRRGAIAGRVSGDRKPPERVA